MKIEKSFELAHAPSEVWDKMGDIRLVADCLPGASITEELGNDRYKGNFSVKLGPLVASFAGEVSMERQPEKRVAVISGKGTDARSSSRVSGSMTYNLTPAEDEQRTRVDVLSEIDLAGSLAQFSKGAIMQEVANRLTTQFVGNFERRLSENSSTSATESIAIADARRPASAKADRPGGDAGNHAQSIDAGAIIKAVLKGRLKAFFRWFSRGGNSKGKQQ